MSGEQRRQNARGMSSGGGMSLGEDLETEILVRLPAESLMRFKCVQKSWNILFKTPSFMNRRKRLMIFHESKSGPCMTHLSCYREREEPTLIESHSLFPNKIRSRTQRIKSCGNWKGVFCLKAFYSGICFGDLILWNPTTTEVHHIPPAPSIRDRGGDQSLYGFGGAVNDDFKVVRLQISFQVGMNIFYPSSAEIYDLSTKSWTPIYPPPPFIRVTRMRNPPYNTLINGIYHWLVGASTSRSGVVNILCFDFHNNEFHILEAPSSHGVPNFRGDDIAEINGSLAYVAEYWDCNLMISLKIWVMDQSGGWTIKHKIGVDESMVSMRGILKDGPQLLGGKVGKQVTLYDHHGNSLRQFQIHITNYPYFWISEYVENIAPLSTS